MFIIAGMAKLADALALGASESNLMGVQVSLPAQIYGVYFAQTWKPDSDEGRKRRGREIFQKKNTCDQVSLPAQKYGVYFAQTWKPDFDEGRKEK